MKKIFGRIIFLTVVMVFILVSSYAAFGEELSHSFSGIRFKTPYQIVKINSPILVEMRNETRLLNIILKDPKNTKFKFSTKLTPMGYENFKERFKKHPADFFLFHTSAYLILGSVKVKEITIIADQFKNSNGFIGVLNKKVKSCKEIILKPDPQYPNIKRLDMQCKPILFEAKVLKIERSSLSPSLPPEYDFPELDYLDIRIEILSVK